MKKTTKLLALLLALVMVVGLLGACGSKEPEKVDEPAEEETEAPVTDEPEEPDAEDEDDADLDETEEPDAEDAEDADAEDADAEDADAEGADVEEPASDTPLVVGYNPFSQKFSPYYADTSYDLDVADMTQVKLITNDRAGELMLQAGTPEGQVSEYNGVPYTYYAISNLEITTVDEDDDGEIEQTLYHFTIRDDIKFSDGEPLTIDDVIFTFYAFSDPKYTGSSTLYSVPILGMNEYRTQTSAELGKKYADIYADMMSKLNPEEEAEGLGWEYEWQEGDSFTADQLAWVKEYVDQTLFKDQLPPLVEFIFTKYGANYASMIGRTAEELQENEGLRTAWAMLMWGFGDPIVDDKGTVAEDDATDEEKAAAAEDDEITGLKTAIEFNEEVVYEKEWDFTADQYPTTDDWYDAMMAAYGNNPYAAAATEIGTDLRPNVTELEQIFILEWGPKDEDATEGGVPNIAGIKKTSDTEFEVVVEGYDASAVYKLGINVTPLHYYGDPDLYDYENNKFGLEFGNQDAIQAKTDFPVGAGAYKFVKYDNKTVFFEANEDYYLGAPKVKYVQFRETKSTDAVQGVVGGTIDAITPSFNAAVVEEIQEANANGELVGETITTMLYDFLGYGYLGINADTVLVGDDPASDASKNLRRAFATIFAQLRYVTNDSYYGDRADTIEYPISNTSWAAPRPADEGYQRAFSVDVEGNPIYKEGMSNDEEKEAAVEAAIGFFKAAGFTYDEAEKKFTAAPAGAKLNYEVVIPADGIGDHPAFGIVSAAKELLDPIGITLDINDPADSNVLWQKIDSGEQEMWTAAWGATIDPDMYQVYHSTNIVGKGGTDSNHYHIADEELDQWIMDARASADMAFRKQMYKACLDRIIDWAVEIPNYQRKDGVIFSTERINVDTIPKDLTPFFGWMSELYKLEMN